MITLTTKEDKDKLRSATLKAMRTSDYEALKTWVRILKSPHTRLSKKTIASLSYNAAKNGEEDLLDFLLEYNKEVTYVIRTLVAYGHIELVKKVQHKYKVKLENTLHGNSSLIIAIRNNFIDLVKYLYEQGIRTESVVLRAVEYNTLEILEYLLEQGESPSYTENQPLKYATNFGMIDYVKLLIKYGAKVNRAVIIATAEYGQLDVLKYYVDNGYDLLDTQESILENSNMYMARYAAHNGHIHILEYLKEQGLDLRIDDDDVLVWAADNNQIDTVKYLVESGADIRAQDDSVCISAGVQGSLDLAKYILSQLKEAETKRDLAAKILGHIPPLNSIVLDEMKDFLKEFLKD